MAKPLQTFASKNALLFSLVVVILSVALISIIPLKGLFTPLMPDQDATYLARLTTRLIVSAILIGLLIRIGLLGRAGFTPLRSWKSPWLVWPASLLVVVNLSDWLAGSVVIDANRPLTIGLYVLYNLSTGLFEETLFRGVVVTVLVMAWGDTKRGILAAVLASSVIFGLAHTVNLISNPQAVIATLAQLVYTFCLGVFFAAVLLRNGSIWPVMIAHALINVSSDLVELTRANGIQAGQAVQAAVSLEGAALTIGLTLPLLLYGLYILREVEPRAEPLSGPS